MTERNKHIDVTPDEKAVIDRFVAEEFDGRVTIGFALKDACQRVMDGQGGDDTETTEDDEPATDRLLA